MAAGDDARFESHEDGGMRALYKSEAGPGLSLVDVPEPEIGPEDVKIRVLRTGICGTDLHILRWDDWAASAVNAVSHCCAAGR